MNIEDVNTLHDLKMKVAELEANTLKLHAIILGSNYTGWTNDATPMDKNRLLDRAKEIDCYVGGNKPMDPRKCFYPNQETINAMNDARDGKNFRSAKSAKEMFDQINSDKEEDLTGEPNCWVVKSSNYIVGCFTDRESAVVVYEKIKAKLDGLYNTGGAMADALDKYPFELCIYSTTLNKDTDKF